MKRKIKNTGLSESDLKKSATNLMLDVVIFVLAGLIILISWSIYNKLRGEDVIEQYQTKSGKASEIIQVEVLNGCGVSGIADRFTDYLRERNIDVVKMSNYISFDINETMVIDRIGNLANAQKVAETLGINPTKAFSQLNDEYFLDVSIIIGKDYYNLNPVK